MSRTFFAVVGGLLAVVSVWATPTSVWAKTCKPYKTVIKVEMKNPEVMFNHKLSVAELNRHFKNTGKRGQGLNGWHSGASYIRGVTSTDPDLRYRFLPGYWRSGSQYCFGVKELTLNFGFKSQTVYIPRIYDRHSCEYKVVKAHEDRHVKINQEGLKIYAAKAKKILAQKLSKSAVAVVNSEKAGVEAMKKVINAAAEDVYKGMNKHILPKHGAIDSTESYRRDDAKCSNWVRDVR